MYFRAKSTLKNNRNYTLKQPVNKGEAKISLRV